MTHLEPSASTAIRPMSFSVINTLPSPMHVPGGEELSLPDI
jgi:hypothetical protein